MTKPKSRQQHSSKKGWSERELRALRVLIEDQVLLEEIVKVMNDKFDKNRSKSAVRQAIIRHGNDWNYEWVPTVRKWAPEELGILVTYYRRFGTRGVAAVLDYAGYSRTLISITTKMYRMERDGEMRKLLTYKQRMRPKRPLQKLPLARKMLAKSLKTKPIVDIQDELHEFTGIDLATLAVAAKQLVKEKQAIELGDHLYARPIKEKQHAQLS
jgi:hypothetical protein